MDSRHFARYVASGRAIASQMKSIRRVDFINLKPLLTFLFAPEARVRSTWLDTKITTTPAHGALAAINLLFDKINLKK